MATNIQRNAKTSEKSVGGNGWDPVVPPLQWWWQCEKWYASWQDKYQSHWAYMYMRLIKRVTLATWASCSTSTLIYTNQQVANSLNTWTLYTFFFCLSVVRWIWNETTTLKLKCWLVLWVGTVALLLSSLTVQEFGDYKKSWVLHWMCNFLCFISNPICWSPVPKQ